MNEKIGRNDLCYCGSGKKYKKCCIATTFVHSEIGDFEWRKIRQLEGSVIDKHLTPYVAKELPDEVMKIAFADCLPEDSPDELDKELLFNQFFIPWFLFNWLPLESFGINDFEPEMTISQNYIKTHGNKLDSVEKRFIEVMNQTYYSFYSVLDVEMEKSLTVKDILLGETHLIKERQGTHHLKRGDIIFSRILTLDSQSIFVGMMPFMVPARYHHHLIDFREWLIEENNNQNLNPHILRNDMDDELLDYFFELIIASFNQPFPILLNTDGELMQFSKSYFKLTMQPEEALCLLLPLTLSKNTEEFLRDAKRDQSNTIQQIKFSWLKKGNKKHKSWNNTVMGEVTIEKDRLTLETNSEKRTEKGKKLFIKYLGDAITFQQTLIESPEQKMKSIPGSSNHVLHEPDFINLPEVQEQIKGMATAHWKNWFDEPIPVLNDQTPREAAETEKGRERLEALLLQYERHDLEKGDNNHFKADIQYLRTELALD